MNSILRLLWKNLRGGRVTLSFPERPPIGGHFRGIVHNDPNECSTCSLCAYMCTSSAITIDRTPDGIDWHYDPGRCTFCARCVLRCPKHALSMEGTRPPVYRVHGELQQTVHVEKKKPAAAKPAAQAEPAGAQ